MGKLETGKQLPLDSDEGGVVAKTKKKTKKRDKRRDRLVVAIILLTSLLVSLGFYLSSGRKMAKKKGGVGVDKEILKGSEKKGFFGSAVYEF